MIKIFHQEPAETISVPAQTSDSTSSA